VKRLLVLLLLVAGGLIAAALAVPTNAATVNGAAISQDALNSDVSAIASSPYYQCYANSQAYLESQGQSTLPPVVGASQGESGTGRHPTVTTAFVASYLDAQIGHELVQQLADHRGVVVTSSDLATARTNYENQINQVMSTMQQTPEAQNPRFTCGTSLTATQVLASLPSSFVDRQVHYFATANALQEDLSGVGSTEADLQAYYEAHRSHFDTVCWTAAVYNSQAEATAALAQAQTTPFAQVAQQAPQGGGAEPCEPLPLIAQRLPSDFKLDELTTGTVSFPIDVGNGQYALIQITSRTPTPYEKAAPLVQSAVLAAGATATQTAVRDTEKHAAISVDPRYGAWVPLAAQVLTPFTPEHADVLNPAANAPNAQAAAAPASA
jgi:hypothetical protein